MRGSTTGRAGVTTATGRAEQLRLLLELRRRQRAATRFDGLDAAGRAAAQRRALDQLRDHAVASSPFYRRHLAGHAHAPLAELPTLTKDDLVEHFDELVTDRALTRAAIDQHMAAGRPGLLLGRYRVATTSGSSGRPAVLAFDRHEWVGHLSAAARGRALAGRGAPPPARPLVRAAKVASPSPWHLSSQVGATLQDPRRPRLGLPADAPLPDLLARLDGFRPDVLSAHPTLLAVLAAEQRAGRLHIDPVRVFSSGGVLTAGTRAALVEAWSAAVHDQYVATEGGTLASECGAHRGLHLLDDRVVVEVVDAEGAPVGPGEEGARVLVSVLDSRTVPLLRYELADSASWAEGPCPCGLTAPRLASVSGKVTEALRLPDGRGGTAVVAPSVLTAVMDATPVAAWQVVERGGALTALVVGAPPELDLEQLGTRLRAALAGLAPATTVSVRAVDQLEAGPGGKLPLVVSRPGDAP